MTASTVFDLAKKNEELAAAAYVKLSGRKQPEAIVNEGPEYTLIQAVAAKR